MKTIFLGLLALVISLSCGLAHAQRRYLPVIDLVDVPLSLANAKPLTSSQVRAGLIAAALAAQWDVESMPDGALKLSLFKDMEYRITLRATYTETSYSLRYVSSDNLKTVVPSEVGRLDERPDSLGEYAKLWRASRGAMQPEFPFAIDRPTLWIHPTYELFVYELSAGVRRHLRLL